MCDNVEPDFCEVRGARSRKPRTCDECDKPIAIGELYARTVGKWDGYFSTFATCRACDNVRGMLTAQCGPAFGHLAEWLSDDYNETDWRTRLAGEPAALGHALGLVYGRRLALDDDAEARRAARRKK